MPTPLNRAVRRSLLESDLVVEITAAGVRMREKRRRTWFGPFPWGKLYTMLGRLEADRIVAERKTRRRRVRRGVL